MARGFHILIKCGDHWALKNKLGKERPIASTQEREKVEAWLSRNEMKWSDIPTIPADGATDEQRCFVCGDCGPMESHHLAPRAIFGDEAEAWPTVDVCASCHDRWHTMMIGYKWNRPVRVEREEGFDPNLLGVTARRRERKEV
jgi:DNA-directed RNA polymerase subunit M/transcription elongation factor TFIIS